MAMAATAARGASATLRRCAPRAAAGRAAAPRRAAAARPARAGRGAVAAGAASGDADAAVAAAEAAEEAAIVVQRLEETSATLRSSGWIAFWAQLVCSVVSTVILLFSLAFEKVSLPGQLGLGLTVAGVGMAFLSTFAAYSLMLLGRALGRAAESGGEGAASKGQVVGRLVKMCYVNVIGMGATVAGAEAVIGLLVGKSLTSATTALFQNGMYNYQPVLPLDIFLVQASINTIVAHFVGLVSSLYLLQKITAPKPVAKAA